MDQPRKKKNSLKQMGFHSKHKSDGSFKRYKAHLMAKDYTQTYNIDNLETFASVAKLNIIRVFLSIADNLRWPLELLDVKDAFLWRFGGKF